MFFKTVAQSRKDRVVIYTVTKYFQRQVQFLVL